MKLLRLSAVLFSAATSLLAFAQSPWIASGPNGGDARAITMDPRDHRHLYLGSVTGTLFESHDGGAAWTRVGRIAGGAFTSEDGGKTWTSIKQLEGHSVRALSQSPSDPKILVAGAIDGVYRSSDGGSTWQKISPQDKEFYEVESIAIDPRDHKTIYVGTWHLPWKTFGRRQDVGA